MKAKTLAVLGVLAALGGRPDGARAVELRGTIVDAASGKAIPARLMIQGAGGRWHFARSADPAGAAVKYDRERSASCVEKHTSLSAHPFAAELPPGRYTLTAERGKEWLSASREIEVGEAAVEVRIELQRWIDASARGWYSGDTHVHRALADLPTAMLAEDLNLTLPLTRWTVTSHKAPEGVDGSAKRASGAPARGEVVAIDPTHVYHTLSTEYEIFTTRGKRHTLGAVFVLGHREPLSLSAPPAAPIATEARRQGALLDLDKHSWPWSLMIVPVMKVDLFELANNHHWRTEFAFHDWTLEAVPSHLKLERNEKGLTERGWTDFGLETYYALLNCGFRLRPTAGTASGVHPVPLGFSRVYVHQPEGFSYSTWMRGLDAGRSFVTTGPLLFATFDGKPPGENFTLAAGGKRVCEVAGTAESSVPIERIEVIVNGERRWSLEAPANRRRETGGFNSPFSVKIELAESSWIAVRCFEKHPLGRLRFAHTAPVFFDRPGEPVRPRRRDVQGFVRRMEEEIERNRTILDESELEEYRRALAAYRALEAIARGDG